MRTRRMDEAGAIAGIEGLAFGVLIFVFGTLLFTTAWGVVDAKLATAAAAREASRAFTEASSSSEAGDVARVAAEQTLKGYGRSLTNFQIVGNFGRCQPIAIEVQTTVPKIALPAIGGSGGTYVVVARHQEGVDPYRSGLEGPATC